MEKTVRMIFNNVMFDTEIEVNEDLRVFRQRLIRFAEGLGATSSPEAWRDLEVYESEGLLTVACPAVALDVEMVDRDARCALFSRQQERQPAFARAGHHFPWQTPVHRTSPPPPMAVDGSAEVLEASSSDADLAAPSVPAELELDGSRQLDLELVDEYGGPLVGWSWRIETAIETLEGVTDRRGRLSSNLSASLAGSCRLRLFLPGDALPARVWELCPCGEVPPHSPAEVQLRLNHLGFYSGRLTGVVDAPTTTAILAFQHYLGQPEPSGFLDEETRRALDALYNEP